MRIKVYWNSHKNLFSCVYKGKVFTRLYNVVLNNVEFKVNQKGRAKVLASKIKNVHAFVCGDIDCSQIINIKKYKKEFVYNPFKGDSFFDKKTNKKLYKSTSVYLSCEDNKPFCFYIE